MAEIGRPSIPATDPAILAKLVNLFRTRPIGYDMAARAVGIAPETFRRWRRLGEAGDPVYMAFCAEIESAKAECVAECLASIHAAGVGGQPEQIVTETQVAILDEKKAPMMVGGKQVFRTLERTVQTKRTPKNPIALLALLARVSPAEFAHIDRVAAQDREAAAAKEAERSQAEAEATDIGSLAEQLRTLPIADQRRLIEAMTSAVSGDATNPDEGAGDA